MQEAEFSILMHKQLQSDCVLGVLYRSDQSHRNELLPITLYLTL